MGLLIVLHLPHPVSLPPSQAGQHHFLLALNSLLSLFSAAAPSVICKVTIKSCHSHLKPFRSPPPQCPHMSSKLLGQTHTSPVPSDPQVPCSLSRGNRQILLQGHTHSCLTLHGSLSLHCPPQSLCLTHHYFPFSIHLRPHGLQQTSWSSQSTGKTSFKTMQRAGEGVCVTALTHRSWLQPPGGHASSCPGAHRAQICTCGQGPGW